MNITIIKDDNAVNVDGVRYPVDCSDLPAPFHALQWDGQRGEIEYAVTRCDHCGARSKKGNETITDLSPYQKYVDAWGTAKQEAEAKEAVRLAAIEAAKQEAVAEPHATS